MSFREKTPDLEAIQEREGADCAAAANGFRFLMIRLLQAHTRRTKNPITA
jgi:hypothetical protein